MRRLPGGRLLVDMADGAVEVDQLLVAAGRTPNTSDLGLDDQVTAIRIALRRLARRFEIETVVAHSQGGLLVQRLQQRLIDRGKSLEHRFGIEEVVLLAPAHPAEVPSTLMDSGAALQVLQSFLITDETLGTVIAIPAAFFPPVFFGLLFFGRFRFEQFGSRYLHFNAT